MGFFNTAVNFIKPYAGDLIGGLIGAGGQYYANQQTAASVAGANEMSRNIAREQMAFQQSMSNSAYQRAVDDMRKAGINPLLAYSQGGASTPAGASYNAQSMRYGDVVAAGISSAKVQADIGLTQDQAMKISEEAKQIMQTTGFQETLHSERWSRLFATMGPENIAASALAVLNGVNVQHVLSGMGANNNNDLKRFLDDVQEFKSVINRETKGTLGVLDMAIQYFNGKAQNAINQFEEKRSKFEWLKPSTW